eukprot:5053193-Amphidinium_carterae.1
MSFSAVVLESGISAMAQEGRNPTVFEGCSYGIRESGAAAAAECRARADTCCMSAKISKRCPISTPGIHSVGFNHWRWLDTDTVAHTEVSWAEIFTEDYVLCVPEVAMSASKWDNTFQHVPCMPQAEGCLAHEQCRHAEYCASCQGCAEPIDD